VVRPLGETRPAWKVLRVLGNLLALPGFDADSSAAVLAAALPGVSSGQVVDAARLSNGAPGLGPAAADQSPATKAPCVASIYQLDSLVRRAPSLQLTQDARNARGEVEGASA
jgi:NADH-quinone oxidoreductase subunit G